MTMMLLELILAGVGAGGAGLFSPKVQSGFNLAVKGIEQFRRQMEAEAKRKGLTLEQHVIELKKNFAQVAINIQDNIDLVGKSDKP